MTEPVLDVGAGVARVPRVAAKLRLEQPYARHSTAAKRLPIGRLLQHSSVEAGVPQQRQRRLSPTFDVEPDSGRGIPLVGKCMSVVAGTSTAEWISRRGAAGCDR